MNFTTRNINVTATFFASQFALRNVLAGMAYYQRNFGAIELRRWSNPEGSVHKAELAIEGALFQLHEEMPGSGSSCPGTLKGTTVTISLFVAAPAAGGHLTSPINDYD